MAAVTQALQLAVEKQIQIATVRDYMIYISCLYTKPVLGTFAAERLAGQLSASAALPPKPRVRVQVMPCGGFFPLCLGLMIRAISFGS